MSEIPHNVKQPNCNGHVDHILSLVEDVSGETIAKVEQELDIYGVVRIGDEAALEIKLRNISVDPNRRNIIGSGRTILQEACIQGHVRIVKMILRLPNITVNRQSFLGKESALHYAVLVSNWKIVFSLLYHGADPNLMNKFGATPLHYAQCQSIASLLCSFGADITKKDENNHTPLSYIKSSGNVYDLELITLLVNAEEKLAKDSLRAELKANSDDKKLFEEQKNHEKEEKRKNDANERRSSLLTQYKRWRQND